MHANEIFKVLFCWCFAAKTPPKVFGVLFHCCFAVGIARRKFKLLFRCCFAALLWLKQPSESFGCYFAALWQLKHHLEISKFKFGLLKQPILIFQVFFFILFFSDFIICFKCDIYFCILKLHNWYIPYFIVLQDKKLR